MPVYSSKDCLKSGIPLGGIGAGKLEILPNGLLNAFTFQNNWSSPLNGARENYAGVLGYHFGVYSQETAKPNAAKKSFLLQTDSVSKIPTINKIKFEGFFPAVKLTYEEPSLGLDVSLEAFSNLFPGDYKDSSLPLVNFVFKIKNKKNTPVKAGLLFMGRNTSGSWCVGRQNKIYENSQSLNLEFSSADSSGADPLQGTLLFSFLKEGWKTSFLESWNAVTKNFSFRPENILLEAWDEFSKTGTLPNKKKSYTASGENQELCGAIAASCDLKPNEEKKLSFCATWYFPDHERGHRYQSFFKSAAQVAEYGLKNEHRFRKKTSAVRELIFELPFPEWFNDALLTNLSPFFSSSWYTKSGKFCFYEAPVVCPLMGTLDVGYYGSIPLSYFFPELENSQMLQFAKAQRPDGYIPHDLGKNRIDLPSNGTTFYLWKDLNPKFILMAYRDFLWSKDHRFLKAIYPHVKKAIAWSLSTDIDGNGLPDNEGADQTFDLWEFFGTSAYTSSLYLASLLACEKMARLMRDDKFLKFSKRAFLKGSASFERELWNGKYFGQTCALSQLNGQWYASLLGLGDIVDSAKIDQALASILKINSRHSDFGMVNSVLSDGRLDRANDHSKNVWAGMNYAFISLCILRGLPLLDLLKPAHKIWDNVTRIQKSPWNQPDTVDSKTGHFVFGDSYYRNMAIWAIPIAYASRDKKTKEVLSKLRAFSVSTKKFA